MAQEAHIEHVYSRLLTFHGRLKALHFNRVGLQTGFDVVPTSERLSEQIAVILTLLLNRFLSRLQACCFQSCFKLCGGIVVTPICNYILLQILIVCYW